MLQRELKTEIETENGRLDRQALSVTYDLARTLQMEKEWDKAEKLQREVRAGREQLLGRTCKDTVLASERLVEILEVQHKLDDALDEVESILKAYEERLGTHHEETRSTTRRLAVMYMRSKKFELAEEKLMAADSTAQASIAENQLQPYNDEVLGVHSNLG